MTVNGWQATGLFFVYGWRGKIGPFYAAGDTDRDRAIKKARAVSSVEANNCRGRAHV